MCMVSFVGVGAAQTIPPAYPWVQPYIQPNTPVFGPDVSREEFDRLRSEMQELRTLLVAAKKFDEATGQPDCEMEDKVDLLKKLAALVGVNLDDVLAV